MISVIIPIYNAEKYIMNTLTSLIQQVERNFEIILVDDGSVDNSAKLADEILANENIPYQIVRQENSGQGIARNTGVQNACGEWLYFLDSDDIVQPHAFQFFERVLRECEDKIDIVYTRYQYVSEVDLFKSKFESFAYRIFNRDEMMRGFLTRERVVLVPGTFYKKSFLEKNKIKHNGIRWSEDQYFMWQVLNRIDTAAYIDCVLYNYYRHPISIMNSTPISVILDAYVEFEKMALNIQSEEVKKYLLPRWVLGCAHEIARRNNFEEWNEFAQRTNLKEKLVTLFTFPSRKIRALSWLGFVSNRLLYKVLRTK